MNSDLVSDLSTVEDYRSDKNKRYPLEEILLLCVCAAIGGADGWKSIAEFGYTKLDWLRKFLEFKVDNIVRHIATCSTEISPCPKMPTPISLL